MNAVQPPHDPRVAVAKKIVLRLAAFVVFTLVVSAVFAVIHLATDRPVRQVLGLGGPEGKDEE